MLKSLFYPDEVLLQPEEHPRFLYVLAVATVYIVLLLCHTSQLEECKHIKCRTALILSYLRVVLRHFINQLNPDVDRTTTCTFRAKVKEGLKLFKQSLHLPLASHPRSRRITTSPVHSSFRVSTHSLRFPLHRQPPLYVIDCILPTWNI